jgi:putative phosphoesterase
MRIAVISDIHGNSVALDHVLQEIDAQGADRIVCLGDVATLGPQPLATVRRLRERGIPCILGNHDDFMLDPAKVREYSKVPVVIQSVEWCHQQLGEEERSYFRNCIEQLEIRENGVRVRFFHGSPTSHSEDITSSMSPARLDQLLGTTEGDVLVFGHTHLQMVVQHKGRYVLNPGSVGSPFKELFFCVAPTIFAHAEYALIDIGPHGEINLSLRRTFPDREKLLESVRTSEYPLRKFLLDQYEKADA